MALITEFNLDLNTHTIVAANEINADLLRVTDEGDRQIYVSAELKRIRQSQLYKPETPYTLLTIGETVVLERASEFVIIRERTEMILDMVFQATPSDDDGADVELQAYADALRTRTLRFLQLRTVDNPDGSQIDRAKPRLWRYSPDTNFKNKLGRGLTRLAVPSTMNLSGTYFTMPFQFKIDVHVAQPIR